MTSTAIASKCTLAEPRIDVPGEFSPSPSCPTACMSYEIERAELSRRGSRHPARAMLAYLTWSRTMSTNAELAVPV
jgi:hypothetical protein